jgi:argininosuccinate synthase
MTEEHSAGDGRTQVRHVADPNRVRVASYLAEPDEVKRVLLLYSGGLDD